MKCPECGFDLEEDVKVCPNCGTRVSSGAESGETTETSETAEGPEEAAPPVEPKKRKLWPIILLIALIAAAIAVWLGFRYYNKHYVAHEIHLAEKSLDLIVGDTSALSFEILPETTKNKSVTWASSNDAVASVSEEGVVTAIGSGQCEITVTTNNGITDVCTVGVKDLIDIQKESIDAVANYIRSSSTEDENGVTVAKIRDVDDERTFALGTFGDDLVLCYRDAVNVESVDVDVNYTTYMNLGYGNIETAEVVQDNQVEIFGYPVTSTMRSTVALPEYQRGAQITAESFETNLEGMEVNDKMQALFTSGVKGCFEEFRSFLEYHPELGCTVEDFGFTAKGDAPVPEPAAVAADSTVESMAESIAEQVMSGAESAVTIVEEVMDPGTDSTASQTESAIPAIEAPASQAEMPAVPVVPAVPGLQESMPELTEDPAASSENAAVEEPEVLPVPVISAPEAVFAPAASAAEEVTAPAASAAEEITAAAESAAEAITAPVAPAEGAIAAPAASVEEEITVPAASAAEAITAPAAPTEGAIAAPAASVEEEITAAAASAAEEVRAAAASAEEEITAPAAPAGEAITAPAAAAGAAVAEAPAVSAMEEEATKSVPETVIAPALPDAQSVIEDTSDLWSTQEVPEAVQPIIADAESAIESVAEEAEAAIAEIVENTESAVSAVEEAAAAVPSVIGTVPETAESVISGAESIVESMAEDIADIVNSRPEASDATESDAEKKFRAITESLGGTMSMPLIPPATVMC